MKTKLGKQRVKVFEGGKAKSVTLNPFEDLSRLESFAQIQLKGRNVGAAILKQGNEHCFVFGFATTGLHDTLDPDQTHTALQNLEAALKEIPYGERVTFHLSSFTTDEDRQSELDRLTINADTSELRLLLMSEKARAQQLAESGVRKPKFLHLYVTYTFNPEQKTTTEADFLENTLASLTEAGERGWSWFSGRAKEYQQAKYETLLHQAFSEGYLRWEQLINIKMGLDVKPLTVDGLWQQIWQRFNRYECPSVPQYLHLDDQGINEVINNELKAASVLVSGERGEPNIPVFDRQWVKVKGKYVAAMVLAEKPAGFVGETAQLRYLWEVLCRSHVIDTEIFCQVAARNSTIIKTNVQRILKQSNLAAHLAEKSRSIDVAAQIKTQRSVDAQAKLYEGAVPVSVATVFLIHRNTKAQLREACNAFSECFHLPAKVIRETEITPRVWMQTMPDAWERLLGAPYKLQKIFLTNEAPGLIPLTRTQSPNSSGFELIADEGGSPLHLDFINQHRNILILGTTRSGKSVLVSGMMTQFLAEGYPIVCLDYPRQDGTSTFTDYTEFLKPNAAYFDIRKQSNNLMEKPDLRALPPELQQERFEDFRSFLEGALVTMVLPTTQQDVLLEHTVRSLIGRALNNFFRDPQINNRYEASIKGGFGSSVWQDAPTLRDFIRFCSAEQLQLDGESPLIRNAQTQIELQLDYWLNSSVGRAIGRPSSFPTDVQLLVFALRGLSNESEAAVLSLSSYAASLRRALAFPKSLFFIDESPILFKFPTIAQLIGRQCANGAKAGIEVWISAQDPDTIVNSAAGSQIMQNMNTRLVGRIEPIAVDSFVRHIGYDRRVIARNASETFFPKRSELYSNWLLDIDGKFTYCRYYPGSVQIAAVANNMDEQLARAAFFARYPDQKLTAMAEFANAYVQAIRSGQRLDTLAQRREERQYA